MNLTGATDLSITRRKKHADGWTVWVKYPWQEQGRNHRVREATSERHKNVVIVCDTCENSGCIGTIAVREHLAGRLTSEQEN